MKEYLRIDFDISPGEKRFTKVTGHEMASAEAMFELIASDYRSRTDRIAQYGPKSLTASGLAIAEGFESGTIWLPRPQHMYVCEAWKGEIRSISADITDTGRVSSYTAEIHAGFPSLLWQMGHGVAPLPDWFTKLHFARTWKLATLTSLDRALDHLRKAI